MIQMIFQWFCTAISGALNIIVEMFMGALELDTSVYVKLFPALETGYYIFRGLGIGLVLVLAGMSLLKFYMPAIFGGRQTTETVPSTLMWAALAGGLVYAGNYLCDKIIDIAKVPLTAFMEMDYTSSGALDFTEFLSSFAKSIVIGSVSGASYALVFLEFVLIIMLAWNILKLMLEVAERYIIVGILLYTSPPFFAMLAASETRDSFKNWAKMFISACAMMAVSVFFLKLILSGINTIGTNVMGSGVSVSASKTFVQLILILATSKVAQKADEYLRQIGLGTATTGGSLLDDMVATGKVIGGVFGGAGRAGKGGSAKSGILGQMGNAMMTQGGIAGHFVSTARARNEAVAQGLPADAVKQRIEDARKMSRFGQKNAATGKAVEDTPGSIAQKAGAGIKARAEATGIAKTVRAGKEAYSKSKADGAGFFDTGKAVFAASGLEAFYATHGVADMARTHSIAEAEAQKEYAESMGKLGEEEKDAEKKLKDIPVNPAASPLMTRYRENQAAHNAVEAEFAGHPEKGVSDADAQFFGQKEGRLSDYNAAKNFRNFGVTDSQGNSFEVTETGDLELGTKAKMAGLEYDSKDKVIRGEPAAVAEAIAGGVGFSPESVNAVLKDTTDITEVVAAAQDAADAKNVAAVNSINEGPSEIAEKLLANPYSQIPNDEIGNAAISKIEPEIAAKADDAGFYNCKSENLEDTKDEAGNTIHGGHCWSANYKDAEGQTHTLESLDPVAYSTLSDANKAGFSRHDLDSGRIEYLRDSLGETGSAFNAADPEPLNVKPAYSADTAADSQSDFAGSVRTDNTQGTVGVKAVETETIPEAPQYAASGTPVDSNESYGAAGARVEAPGPVESGSAESEIRAAGQAAAEYNAVLSSAIEAVIPTIAADVEGQPGSKFFNVMASGSIVQSDGSTGIGWEAYAREKDGSISRFYGSSESGTEVHVQKNATTDFADRRTDESADYAKPESAHEQFYTASGSNRRTGNHSGSDRQRAENNAAYIRTKDYYEKERESSRESLESLRTKKKARQNQYKEDARAHGYNERFDPEK